MSDIINRKPPFIIRNGILIVAVLFFLLLIVSSILGYPEEIVCPAVVKIGDCSRVHCSPKSDFFTASVQSVDVNYTCSCDEDKSLDLFYRGFEEPNAVKDNQQNRTGGQVEARGIRLYNVHKAICSGNLDLGKCCDVSSLVNDNGDSSREGDMRRTGKVIGFLRVGSESFRRVIKGQDIVFYWKNSSVKMYGKIDSLMEVCTRGDSLVYSVEMDASAAKAFEVLKADCQINCQARVSIGKKSVLKSILSFD